MRPLFILTLVWLAFQFGSLALSVSRRGDRPSAREVEAVLKTWPAGSQRVAHKVIRQHGLPDGTIENMLWWKEQDQVDIVLYRDARLDGARAHQATAAERMVSSRNEMR